MAVDAGEYGPVLILVGAHQGQVGYYDDDDGQQAIVYLGEPFVSDYILVRRADLEKVTRDAPRLGAVEAQVPVGREAARPAVIGQR